MSVCIFVYVCMYTCMYVTTGLEDLLPSSGLNLHCIHVVHIHAPSHTHIHIKTNISREEFFKGPSKLIN